MRWSWLVVAAALLLYPWVLTGPFYERMGADLLLAVGTSLQVHPVAGVVPLAKSAGARLMIINAQPTPFDDLADEIMRQPIGDVLPALCSDVSGRA